MGARHVSASGESLAGHVLGDTTGRGGDEGRRRSEGLGDRHLTLLHVLEVSLPRDVHTRGIVLPCHVHLIDVVGGATSKERIVGVLFT